MGSNLFYVLRLPKKMRTSIVVCTLIGIISKFPLACTVLGKKVASDRIKNWFELACECV